MNNKYLKQSAIMHIAVFAMMMIDMPNFWHKDMTIGTTPIIVDLSQVRIDELTNLPSEAEFGPEDRKATVAEHKNTPQYTKDEKPEPQPEPSPEPEDIKAEPDEPDIQPQEIKDDYLEPPLPDKKPEKKPDPKPTPKKPPIPSSKPKPKPKPEPKAKPENKPAAKPKEQSSVRSNALKSLMQEIDNERNLDIGEQTQKAMIREGTEVNNMGIRGGSSNGSYFSALTISETDAIASLLSQNWQLDPGAMGLENLVVEILVELGRDGTIKNVKVVDEYRNRNDASFHNVAESAVRAVYLTQQAFKEVFGAKYADKYETWQTLRLYFDPLDKAVR